MVHPIASGVTLGNVGYIRNKTEKAREEKAIKQHPLTPSALVHFVMPVILTPK